MRRRGLAGRTVTVKVKYSYGNGRTIQRRLPHATDDENIFVSVARSLMDEIWTEGTHIRLLGIGMSDFRCDGDVQTDLFCEVDERGAVASSKRELSVAVDKVRERFGSGAVNFGRAARFGDDLVRPDKFLNQNKPSDA